MKKVVFFAFNGETMCFIHVLLNGFRYESKWLRYKNCHRR